MKIDSNIPLPAKRFRTVAETEFSKTVKKMKIGDSVLFKDKKQALNFNATVRRLGERTKPNFKNKFSIVKGGFRVWKIEAK